MHNFLIGWRMVVAGSLLRTCDVKGEVMLCLAECGAGRFPEVTQLNSGELATCCAASSLHTSSTAPLLTLHRLLIAASLPSGQ